MNNHIKGKSFEQQVASMIRKKADHMAKRNAGSHANWHRRSDVFTELPIHVECKDQETIKIKEWFRQADDASSFNQVPTVVFQADENVLCTLKFNDLLDLFVQVADLQAENEDLRQPLVQSAVLETASTSTVQNTSAEIAPVVEKKIERGNTTCRAGHLADLWGYCQQKDCKFSRGYKPPKKARK